MKKKYPNNEITGITIPEIIINRAIEWINDQLEKDSNIEILGLCTTLEQKTGAEITTAQRLISECEVKALNLGVCNPGMSYWISPTTNRLSDLPFVSFRGYLPHNTNLPPYFTDNKKAAENWYSNRLLVLKELLKKIM